MPYQLDTSIRPEPLRQSGSVPAAFQRSNPDDPEWPIPAWSCQFFSLNAVPPSRTKHQSSKRDKKTWDISPFPATTPRKSRQDFGTPSLALDHIVLQDKSTSSDEKEALLEEREKQKSYVMSLTIYASKKRIHKLAHVRNTVRKRIRAAIRLIVQGGLAPSTTSTFKRRIKGPAHYLLPGHRYTVQTSLELYRLPMDQLVLLMTQALRQIFVSYFLAALESCSIS